MAPLLHRAAIMMCHIKLQRRVKKDAFGVHRNRVNVCIHDTTGCQPRCQTGCTTRFDNRLDVCLHDTPGCQTGVCCTTGLTTGCIV